MTTEREAWLALTEEQPIDPGLPTYDPHHHSARPSHTSAVLSLYSGKSG